MTTQLSKATQEKFLIGEGKNSRTFISNGWSPLRAAKHLPKIGKQFATPVSFLFGATEDNFGDLIPQALYMLFEQMEENDIEDLLSTILQDVYLQGEPHPVDLGHDFYNLDELLCLVALVLKQHYGCLIEGKGFTNLFQVMVPLNKLAAV